jgi:hypothetical protein
MQAWLVEPPGGGMQQRICFGGEGSDTDPAGDAIGTRNKADLDQVSRGLRPRCSFAAQSFLGSFLASDQLGNRWGQLGANALPVSQTVGSNAEAFSLAGSHWVVEADTLYETAIATIAGIGCNDVVERTLLGATTS